MVLLCLRFDSISVMFSMLHRLTDSINYSIEIERSVRRVAQSKIQWILHKLDVNVSYFLDATCTLSLQENMVARRACANVFVENWRRMWWQFLWWILFPFRQIPTSTVFFRCKFEIVQNTIFTDFIYNFRKFSRWLALPNLENSQHNTSRTNNMGIYYIFLFQSYKLSDAHVIGNGNVRSEQPVFKRGFFGGAIKTLSLSSKSSGKDIDFLSL